MNLSPIYSLLLALILVFANSWEEYLFAAGNDNDDSGKNEPEQ